MTVFIVVLGEGEGGGRRGREKGEGEGGGRRGREEGEGRRGGRRYFLQHFIGCLQLPIFDPS